MAKASQNSEDEWVEMRAAFPDQKLLLQWNGNPTSLLEQFSRKQTALSLSPLLWAE